MPCDVYWSGVVGHCTVHTNYISWRGRAAVLAGLQGAGHATVLSQYKPDCLIIACYLQDQAGLAKQWLLPLSQAASCHTRPTLPRYRPRSPCNCNHHNTTPQQRHSSPPGSLDCSEPPRVSRPRYLVLRYDARPPPHTCPVQLGQCEVLVQVVGGRLAGLGWCPAWERSHEAVRPSRPPAVGCQRRPGPHSTSHRALGGGAGQGGLQQISGDIPDQMIRSLHLLETFPSLFVNALSRTERRLQQIVIIHGLQWASDYPLNQNDLELTANRALAILHQIVFSVKLYENSSLRYVFQKCSETQTEL